jgi:hypothetical protein
MKVVMRVKPNLVNKIPRRVMRVGKHMVTRDKQVFEIDKDDIEHLESVGTQHWVEVEKYNYNKHKKEVVNIEIKDEKSE